MANSTPTNLTPREAILGIVELLAKAGGAGVGFAYLSGYLIVTTYLSSFGVKRDGSDLFRTSYIAVGFLFTIFLMAIAVFLCAIKVALDFKKRKEDPENTRLWDADLKNISLSRRGFLVWAIVVLLLECSLATQMSVLHSSRIREYMSLQFGLLLSVAMYQLTYYRALHSYQWDRSSRLVHNLRIRCLGAESVFAIFVFAAAIGLETPMFKDASSIYRNYLWVDLAFFVAAVLPTAVIFLPFSLSSARRTELEALGYVRPLLDFPKALGMATRREVSQMFGAVFLFGLLLWPLAIPDSTPIAYYARWAYIKYANLFSVIIVLSGIVVQSIGISLRRKAAEGAPEALAREADNTPSPTTTWTRWILRISAVVVLYVAASLGYAYVIYEHIPVQKNGGDYTTAPVVRLILRDEYLTPGSANSNNWSYDPTLSQETRKLETVSGTYPCLIDVSIPCTDLIVLDQDEAFIYVTSIHGTCKSIDGQSIPNCGPHDWKNGFQDERGPLRPSIQAINLKRVAVVQDE